MTFVVLVVVIVVVVVIFVVVVVFYSVWPMLARGSEICHFLTEVITGVQINLRTRGVCSDQV